MNWRRAHWIFATATLVVFLLTGAYMRWIRVPPVPQLDDLTRAVYRSFALAGPAKQRARQFASVLVLVAPALFPVAFAVEPAQGIHGGPLSQIALYLLFAAAVILVYVGVRVARN
jgi:hypothetical protein